MGVRSIVQPEAFLSDLISEGKSEFNYRELIQHLAAAIYTCDATGRISFYNQAAVDLWGREPKAGQDLWCGSWKIYRPDGSPMPLDECPMAICLKEKRSVSGEEIIVERPDGKRLWVQPHPRPIIENGVLLGAVNMLLDISSKKNAEQLILQSEMQYRQLVHGLPAAAYMCDLEGRLILYNKAAEELWGRTPSAEDRWCGAWKAYRVDGSELPFSEAPLARSIMSGNFEKGSELIIERPDGSRKHIIPYPQPVYDSKGELIFAVNMITDITEQKSSEEALKQSEARYRQLVDSLERKVIERTRTLQLKNLELKRSEERYHKMVEEVVDYAILLLDRNGVILNWNKGAQKIKGYPEEEIIGRHFSTFYLPEDCASRLPERLISEAAVKGRSTHEGWRIRKDRTTFWASTVLTALHDEQNNIIGFSKVTRDLTEKKLAEEKMQMYTAELEQFAYIASHDLQEPLRKIQVFSELLEQNQDNADMVSKYLEKIHSSANRMSRLIKDVLHYTVVAKTEEIFTETDLNQVLADVKDDFELLISQKQVTINHPPLPSVKGIPVQLRQLFANLLSNSIQFCEQKPVINISSQKIMNGELKQYPELNSNLAYLKITFNDNGIGFEQKYAEQIFKLFQRLHTIPYGTGIGLALCKRIIENHHGHITVSSELSKGSTFELFLPLP
jgi:PAS domain S-box-containing protein